MSINQTIFQRRDSSRSPMSNRRRHIGDREEPDPSKCIGVFGLSLYTTESQLDNEFGRSAIFTSIIVISMNPPPGLKHITKPESNHLQPKRHHNFSQD